MGEVRFKFLPVPGSRGRTVESPPEKVHGVFLSPPRQNVICGHQYDDGDICRVSLVASPHHTHIPGMGRLGPTVPNPTRGLNPGAPVPSYAELRAVYGDPADLPPILPQHQTALRLPPPLISAAEAAERVNEAAAVLRDTVGVSATDVGKVDFRDMLKDEAAWSARSRLEKVLGRPYLATALVDQLNPETAAKLADRLESLVSQAVAETELRISSEVASVVTDKISQISVDRAARAKQMEEARRERFGRTSRLD